MNTNFGINEKLSNRQIMRCFESLLRKPCNWANQFIDQPFYHLKN